MPLAPSWFARSARRLPGIVLDGLQMSGWIFYGAVADCASSRSRSDGADFSEVQAARADFRGASLGIRALRARK
jgi:uncharacterized protein YjbI with pentapeptide repeats